MANKSINSSLQAQRPGFWVSKSPGLLYLPDLIPDKEVTARGDHLVPRDLRCIGTSAVNCMGEELRARN